MSKELKGAAKVAATLNAEGCRTSQRTIRTRDKQEKVIGGKRFIPEQDQGHCDQSRYKGIISHDGHEYKGEHPPIVTPKLWAATNEALSRKERNRKTLLERNVYETLLKGLIRCGDNGQLQRYLKLAGETDSAHFAQESLAKAEELAAEKHELEREQEKVKIDIAYREQVVTDEKLISESS